MLKDNIKIKGHVGKWHVIDEKEYSGKMVYLLEHDMAAGLIIDKDLNVILDDVWNGFLDLDESEE